MNSTYRVNSSQLNSLLMINTSGCKRSYKSIFGNLQKEYIFVPKIHDNAIPKIDYACQCRNNYHYEDNYGECGFDRHFCPNYAN